MKTRNRRITTFLLSLLILLSCIPFGSNAEEASLYCSEFNDSYMDSLSNRNSLISNDEAVSSVLEQFDKSLSDPDALAEAEAAYRERMERERADAFIAESKIAEYVNVNDFYETKPMFRVKAQESLNSYVFQDANGIKTVYMMAENVKYIDEHGDVREKDINLTVSSEGYAVNDSDIKLLLPKRLSDGIMLNTAFGSVTLTPQYHTDSAAKFDEKSNSVNYENAFGEGSFLRYVPTLSGLKEDLVLDTRLESNAFAFTLYAPGMTLELEDGIYFLVAADNKEQRIRFDQIFIYDANRRFTAGNMTVKKESDSLFLLTVIAPSEFLDDPETVYPVTIDPSFSISTDQYSSNIIDAAVYANKPTMNAGTWQYDNIGYTDSTYGLARTVIKLSALLSNSTYQNLTANQINNVTFSVKEATGNSSKTVKLHPITGTPTWTESTVTWNNYGSFDTTVNYGGTLTGDVWTHFNITNLVKAWKNGSYNGNGCFIFIMGGTENSQNRALYSTEYSGTGNRPYLSLTYTPAVSLTSYSIYINEGSLTFATCNVAPEGTYRFEWQTDRSEIATCSTNNYSSSVVTGVRSGYTYLTVNVYDSNNNWIDDTTAMVFVLKPDGIYKIINSQELRPLKSDGTISNEMSATMSTVSYDSGPEIDRIKVMWRIKHIIYGYYSVRPLYKSDTCLASDSNNNAVSRYTGTTDTWNGTAWDEKWKIEWETDNNYCLTQYTSGKRLTIHFNNLEDQDAVFVRTDTASNERCQWLFQPVNDVPIGIYLYDMATGDVFVNTPTKYIAPEETRSYTDIGVAPVAYSSDVIDQSFSWFSGVIADATVTSSGNVTGVNSTGNGYVGIFVRWDCQEHSNVTNKYWLQVLNVANGLYYLENRTVEYFASIIDTNVVSNVTKVYQHEFLGENNMLWQINRFDDNYYTITSYNYPSFKLSTFDPLTVNSDIVVQSGTVTDDMLWKIEPTSAGAYKLISKSSGNNSWVLATNTSNQTNGIKLILGQYVVNDSYRDEWFMCRQNNTIYDTLLLSVYHTGGNPFDTYQGMGNSIHFLQDIGKKVNFIKTEYTPVGTLFDFLNNSSIAVIGSHGASYSQNEAPYYLDMTEMLLYNNSWTNPEFQSKIRSIDIYNQVTGHSLGQVSNLDLIIYLGCKTGAETFNLCTQSVVDFSIGGVTYNGAEIAIGFKNNITSPSCNRWLKQFFKYYSQNHTVDECVEYASNSVGNDKNGLKKNNILIAYRED